MPLPSLKHYNYDDLDGSCGCALCNHYRHAVKAYEAYIQGKSSHVWSCTCAECKTRMKIYEEVLLSSLKRETYSELSFLCENHPDKGPFLAWVWRATQYPDGHRRTFSRAWWLDRGAKVPLGWWLRKWKMLSGVDIINDLMKKGP